MSTNPPIIYNKIYTCPACQQIVTCPLKDCEHDWHTCEPCDIAALAEHRRTIPPHPSWSTT